ncbi:MAG: FAD-dependent oxidoreductase [Chitinophagaceae bacterium]|nr:FAD-dependent oxidoreductase [Chitinophagaceae bacterium]
MSITRRNFIRQGGLLTGGVVLRSAAGSLYAPALKTPVIIIGAGLAGLAAAYQLKKKKIGFVILESRTRIGGRVLSHHMTPELVVELGGEWVGNSHTGMHSLCAEMGLNLLNNQLDTHLIYRGVYSSKGNWGVSNEWKAKFTSILKEYPKLTEADKMQLDKMDWWRYLVSNGCEGRDLDLRELADSTDFGESIRHVSAYAALAEYAESSEKNEMDLKIEGGNGMLASKLAERIGKEHILTGHTVNRIVQGSGVKVYCDNGKVFEGSKLICTLPTFAMNKIDWQPGLPAEKKAAINELQYARINKHAMLFNQRFWQDESFDMITDQAPHYFYHATKNQPSEQGILVSYTIGDKAALAANQGNEWNAEMVQSTLKPFFGDVKSLMKDQTNYYWGDDDYSKGAYALFGVNQWFRIRPILEKTFLHTHFAGEHLADWQGFMEGAINTGEAAAGKI